MSELAAAVGLAQLRRFPARMARRQEAAARYVMALSKTAGPTFPRDVAAAPFQSFPVALPSERAAGIAVACAADAGLELRRYYRPSLSRWPNVQCREACPVAESLAARTITLPVRADGTDALAVEAIALDAVRDALAQA